MKLSLPVAPLFVAAQCPYTNRATTLNDLTFVPYHGSVSLSYFLNLNSGYFVVNKTLVSGHNITVSRQRNYQNNDLNVTISVTDLGKNGLSVLDFNLVPPIAGCTPFEELTIRSGCDITARQLLYSFNSYQNLTLPANYRVPSQYGALVATSGNVYNADPAVAIDERWNRKTAVFNACLGKSSSADCNCDGLRNTTSISNTDCIVTVPVVYEGVFKN